MFSFSSLFIQKSVILLFNLFGNFFKSISDTVRFQSKYWVSNNITGNKVAQIDEVTGTLRQTGITVRWVAT